MSDTLPPLPETPWVALIHTAAPYEPEWTSRQDGYDKETMKAYASAAVAAERERWIAKAGATYTEAHAIFNDPSCMTSQDVRDVIEWHLHAMRHSEIEIET
jgi:hypothetical protein